MNIIKLPQWRPIMAGAVMVALLLLGNTFSSIQAQSENILLQTSLNNLDAITQPITGTSGTTTLSAEDFVESDGRIGMIATNDGKSVAFPTVANGVQNIEFDQGEISFWYQPNYNSDDEDIQHSLITVGDPYNVPRFEIVESDFFSLTLVDANWNITSTSAEYRAPLWQSGEWVHIRATWDTQSTEDALALYINDMRVDSGGAVGGWNLGDESTIGDIYVGSANANDEFPADGIMSELVIRGEPGEGSPVVIDDSPPNVEESVDETLPVDDSSPDPPTISDGAYEVTVIDDNFLHGQGIEVVDIDFDGDMDIVVAISLNDTVYLFINDGEGNFTRINVAPENSIAAMWAASGDYDSDGDLDIAAVALTQRECVFCSPGEVYWYENTGDVSSGWTAHLLADDMWGLRYIVADDLNDDGLPDLVVSELQIENDGAGIYWFRNSGGAFEGPITVDAELPNVERVLLYDVDANGTLDILATANFGDEIAWYSNSGGDNPTFEKFTIDRPAAPYDLLLMDIDGDETPELIASTDDGILWYAIPEDFTSEWTRNIIDADFGATGNPRLSGGDLNADGRLDIAITMNSADFGTSEIRVYTNNNEGTWTAQVVSPNYFGVVDIKTIDVDSDGDLELVTTTYNHTETNDELGVWDTE